MQQSNLPDDLLALVSRETIAKLEVYVSLLTQWNKRINLISHKDAEQIWSRHIQDSLQLTNLISSARSIIDLGSGGGFPGLVLAIVTDIPTTLVESDTRKAIFLREVIRQTQCNCKVLSQRIETIDVPAADIITARALAPLSKLLSFSAPLLQANGSCLFLKGRQVDQEIMDAEKIWHFQYRRFPSQTHSEGVILKVSHIQPISELDG